MTSHDHHILNIVRAFGHITINIHVTLLGHITINIHVTLLGHITFRFNMTSLVLRTKIDIQHAAVNPKY